MDQERLIAGCKRGDPDAQRTLYERFGQRIYRLMFRMAGNPHDAFDLTQDAFVRAYGAVQSFDGRSRLDTWLHRIAVNEALQLLRRRRTERRHLPAIAELEPRTSRPEGPDLADEIPAALERLPAEARAILVLKYYEKLSYDEIAQVLGCPAGTVGSRLSRARAQLRQILEPESAPATEDLPAGRIK